MHRRGVDSGARRTDSPPLYDDNGTGDAYRPRTAHGRSLRQSRTNNPISAGSGGTEPWFQPDTVAIGSAAPMPRYPARSSSIDSSVRTWSSSDQSSDAGRPRRTVTGLTNESDSMPRSVSMISDPMGDYAPQTRYPGPVDTYGLRPSLSSTYAESAQGGSSPWLPAAEPNYQFTVPPGMSPPESSFGSRRANDYDTGTSSSWVPRNLISDSAPYMSSPETIPATPLVMQPPGEVTMSSPRPNVARYRRTERAAYDTLGSDAYQRYNASQRPELPIRSSTNYVEMVDTARSPQFVVSDLDRPYRCPIYGCQAAFSRRDVLDQHVLHKHRIMQT